tara:strand:+ start:49 stop:2388 length:2340 start_codon:yes stop_codon:yes gene_type:complete
MAVYYIDPENGNDSNSGTSFANRKKTITATTSGDEVRFIRSPAPTSLGNANWEKDATYNDEKLTVTSRNITGCSFNGQSSGNPTTVAKTGHGLSTGDAIYVNDGGYTYAGVHQITKVDDDNFTIDGTENAADTNATSETVFKLNPFCVRLASSPIKNIICHQGLDGGGDLDWTATVGTTFRESGNYQSGFKTARGFKPGNDATGKVAYVQLNNALDLSGYQQISLKFFWDYCPSGQKNDEGVFSLRLCSDTSGDTTVHTVPLKPPCGDDQDQWIWYTHDFGTNLNSSIQSIALHVDVETEHNNTEIFIDNVIACKAKSSADSLHLGSLIGKGTTYMSNWYPIMAIVDKIVLIQNSAVQSHDGLNDHTRPLLETTETVTTYKQECFTKPEYYDNSENSGSPFVRISSDSNVTISGGWNSTDMSSQDANAGTWLGLQGRQYSGIEALSCQNLSISNIGVVRGYHAFGVEGMEEGVGTFTNCQAIVSYYAGHGNDRTLYDNCKWSYCYIGHQSEWYRPIDYVVKNSTYTYTYFANEVPNLGGKRTIINSTFQGTYEAGLHLLNWSAYGNIENLFSNCTFKNLHALAHGEDFRGHYSFTNCTFEDSMEDIFDIIDQDDGKRSDKLPFLSFINYDNTANDHRLYYMNCLVTSDSTITQSGSGYSWKFTALSTTAYHTRDADFPLRFKLAEVYVTANSQVTATIYARRTDNQTNDYVALAALAVDNAAVGITTDVKSSALSGSVDTWVQLTLTFTPTIAGVATITALMSASSTSDNVWIDTLEIA